MAELHGSLPSLPDPRPSVTLIPWSQMSFLDFLVEFFGSLVPGIVFVAAGVLVLAWPCYSFVVLASDSSHVPQPSFTVDLLKNAEWATLITLLCTSYILGHLFYRQDPAKPDELSFEHLKNADEKNPQGQVIDEKFLRNQYGCASKKECRFPYLYLGEYLRYRGLSHLLWFVIWEKTDCEGNALAVVENFRSKNYINILKIRLAFWAHEHYGVIARNEAHIRLMTSTWYLCKALFYVSIAGVIIAGLCIPFFHIVADCFPLLAAAFAVLVITWQVRRAIEIPLHYMRLREIIFVLETAHTAFIRQPEILADVFTKFGAKRDEPNC